MSPLPISKHASLGGKRKVEFGETNTWESFITDWIEDWIICYKSDEERFFELGDWV